MLELNPRAGYILAVRIQHGEIVTALMDLDHHIIGNLRNKVDTNDPSEVVKLIGEAFDEIISETKIPRHLIYRCGVASPGLVDSYQGVIERSSNLRWGRVSFGEMISDALRGIPVHVENISNAAALGEQKYGSGLECPHLVYLNLSVGIGAGIIIDHRLFGGAQGYAGEIGSTIIPYLHGGEEISYRTLESICGIQAVMQHIKSVVSDDQLQKFGLSKARISYEELLTPPLSNLPEVHQILVQACNLIGIKVAEMIHLFNTKMVIMGGEWTRAGNLLLDIVRKTVEQNTLTEMSDSVQIILSTMREDPPLMGVYALVLDRLFQTDEWIKNSNEYSE
jgi:predicted NBD/HSP70 family sugar kinase